MKKLLSTIPYLLVAILVGVTVTYAGNLTPPGAPAKTMKSLADLYELVNTGSDTPSVDFTTPGVISATMNSIEDIYDLLTTNIAAIDPATVLTGTTIFGVDGSASAAPGPLVWSAADITSYDCAWLTTATDPTQPGLTSAQICAFNTGCTWNAGTSNCDGGVQSITYPTWYASKAICENSTEGGQSAGTWRMPHYWELAQAFQEGTLLADYKWSDMTVQNNAAQALSITMTLATSNWTDYEDNKNAEGYDGIRCVR
jgi:hypothetical protein